MNRNLKQEQVKSSVMSVTGFMMFIAILAAVNFIAGFLFFRLDVTQNRIYSLSKFSKKLVGSLDDPVIIKAYFSESLPPPYSTYRKYLQQLLDEYRVYSKHKVKVTFIRYDDAKKFEMEAQRQGIPPLRFDQVKSDKYEVSVAFMGLVITYGDAQEVIPVVKSIDGLEYDITSRIRRLVNTEKKKIGFLTGHDEIDVLQDQEELSQALNRDYTVIKPDLQGSTTFPADMAALVIAGPEKQFSDTDLFAVDQFIMQGKPVAFFISMYKPDLTAFRVSELNTGIDKLLSAYGVTIKKSMVIDPQCQRIGITQRQGMFNIQNIIDYKFVPQIVQVQSKNAVVKDLNSLSFPFVSPLELSTADNKNIKTEELIWSSKHSWAQDRVYSVNPFDELAPPEPGQRGEKLLAAILEGSLKSYYATNPPPQKAAKDTILTVSKPTRILVVGTGALLNKKMPTDPSNFTFFQNAVDWMTQDDGLIAIRSKGVSYQPIKEQPAFVRALYKYLNIFLMPIGMVAFGLYRWRVRKLYKETIALKYKAGEYVG